MPFPRKHRLARLAAAAGAIAALAAPGTAAAADGPVCTPKVSTPVFAAFGDLRDYYLAPGGAFEDSLTWTKNSGGVAIVQGNEPFLLAGATHKTSVRLWSGGKITSPKLCVSALEPDMRFVGKHNGGGQLDVTVRVYDEDGDVASSSTGSIAPAHHATWRPSRDVHLNTERFADSTGYIDVSFRSQGDWQVDNVFIDPYQR